MKQLLLNTPPDEGGGVLLEGKDYHYLVRVRRLKEGDRFPVLLPGALSATVRIDSLSGGILKGTCMDAAPEGEFRPRLILFQALPRNAKMDTIVRLAAEGAVAEVVPFFSACSLPRGGEAKKAERWRRIIREGLQQSGSPVATSLREPCSFDDALAYWDSLKDTGAAAILFHHIPLARSTLHSYLCTYPDTVVIAIGPEGGFSPHEAERFIHAGFRPITLGNTVFRVETAALYCCAAVRVILLESSSWKLKETPDTAGRNS
jgi:16S rRNA (uracil1498-N3)-methyltransferase